MSSHRRFLPVALLAAGLFGVATTGLSASAEAAGRPVATATAAEKAEAQKAYLAAVEQYKAKQLDQALAGFRASYDIVASPNSHMMIVNVLVDLGRRAEAFEEAELVAIEAEALGRTYAATAKAARDAGAELRAKLGYVTVELVPGAELRALRVGGRPILEARWGRPIVADPGNVEVTADTARGSEKQVAIVAAGAVVNVKIGAASLPPAAAVAATTDEAEPPKGPSRLAPFLQDKRRVAGLAVAGVGVVGLVSFAVLGSMNNSKFSDIEAQCPNNECPPSADEDISSGKSLQTAANVMAAVGFVGLAAGAGLITWSYVDKEGKGTSQVTMGRASEPPPVTAKHVRVQVGPGTVGLEGRF